MKQPSDAQVSDSSVPDEPVAQPVETEDLEQEVEDLLADTLDLLLTHTEGTDSFRVSRRADEQDKGLVRFVVTPKVEGKAAGILIGRDGKMANALRTLVVHLGHTHRRRFRLTLDLPPMPRRKGLDR